MNPRRLSREEFAVAIQRGQGRALMHVLRFGLEGVANLVLAACLNNQAWDPQCEGSRERWLLPMFSDTTEFKRFKETILAALEEETETWDFLQLCGLAKEMALRGNDDARQVLAMAVLCHAETGIDDAWAGAEEWIALDGIGAIVQLARCHGSRLLRETGYWGPPRLPDMVEAADMRAKAKATLDDLAKTDANVKAYWEYYSRETESAKARPEFPGIRTRICQLYPIERILSDAYSEGEQSLGRYYRFGQFATEDELLTVYRRLQKETERESCLRLLSVFRNAAIPELHPRLWDWSLGNDQKLRSAALAALSRIKDERIGEFAKRQLRAGELGSCPELLDLFILNYEPMDVDLILSRLQALDADRDTAHSLGSSIVRICEQRGALELSGMLRWVYEVTPCSECRLNSVNLLCKIGALESAVAEECIYDASEDIQACARQLRDGQGS